MPVYLLAGPLVAVVGIVAVFFVMRHKSTQTRSMYSSRRSNLERKVKAARQRTLATSERGHKTPSAEEIAALTPAQPMYQAPAPSVRWDAGPAAAAPAPAAAPPAYAPPSPPPYSPPPPAPEAPAEAAPPAPEPVWTPAPMEPSWTPSPAAPEPSWTPAAPAEAPSPPTPPAAAEPVATAASSTGGASWSIVGETKAVEEEAATKGKRKGKKQAATGSAWQLASGEGPSEGAEEVTGPSTTMAVAQYAVLVVGLIMVLIGVLVMVANSKVT